MGRGGCLGRAGLGNAKMSDCPFTVWQKELRSAGFHRFCILHRPWPVRFCKSRREKEKLYAPANRRPRRP